MQLRWILLITMPVTVLFFGSVLNKERQVNTELQPRPAPYHQLFQTSDACMSCHNGLLTPSGQDISFGTDWSTTMMANSARDPYWHAAVRREVTDHPQAQAHIESECSTCHMPMAHYEALKNGQPAKVFANLPINSAVSRINLLAADGVSCTTCHQITDENLGERESFVGRFGLDTTTVMGQRQIFGPYPVDEGLSGIMHSSSGFRQTQSKHIQRSEVCATCHTLYTETLGPDGEVIGELPEQVPYQEWEHSSFVDSRSCQSCHMPVVEQEVAISSVMGTPRQEVSRHTFNGGNFFMQSMLNRYRDELGVKVLPQEMDAAVNRTIDHLQSASADIELRDITIKNNQLQAQVLIDNLAGHKLPTAYPSRRVWIYFSVQDESGRTIFESGAVQPDGSIAGNINDEDDTRYEQHYNEITQPDQVQIYEAIMEDPEGKVTTGLLTAIRYTKDNRMLPDGFDKTTAGEDIAVHGQAYEDQNFVGGSDRITYLVDIPDTEGPFTIDVELWYQPIGYRWAQNLAAYDAPETNRFVGYYNAMSEVSAVKLAWTSTAISTK